MARFDSENSTKLLPPGAEELAKELSQSVTMLPYKFLMSGKKPELGDQLWAELSKYEQQFAEKKQPFLMGDHISVPDCILWATLLRYDNIYARQFGLNDGKTIKDNFPNLTAYAARIWNTPSKLSSGGTLGEEARLPEIIRMYWQSEDISPLAGNDSKSDVPETVSLF